jgi:hypothetical protein
VTHGPWRSFLKQTRVFSGTKQETFSLYIATMDERVESAAASLRADRSSKMTSSLAMQFAENAIFMRAVHASLRSLSRRKIWDDFNYNLFLTCEQWLLSLSLRLNAWALYFYYKLYALGACGNVDEAHGLLLCRFFSAWQVVMPVWQRVTRQFKNTAIITGLKVVFNLSVHHDIAQAFQG